MVKKDYNDFEYYYNLGFNDVEIGEKLKCSYATISLWRKRNNYPTINQLKKNKIIELFKKGKTKKEIIDLGISSPKYTMYLLRGKVDTNKFTKLAYIQQCSIIGTLLGDSWVNIQNTFGFGHKQEHVEYSKLKSSVINLSYKETYREQFRNETLCKSTTFTFHTHPYFKELRNLFYPNGKKQIPLDYIKPFLTWRLLCYWYLDDGNNLSGNRGCCISMYNFKNQAKEIRDLLETVFKIKFTIQHSGNVLYIPYREKERFFNKIKEFIPKCMRYKCVLNKSDKLLETPNIELDENN